ncbi:hypothetical protein B0H14DRAFT_2932068 [Mycena olivaceomarginata]|nr:hypothetical protein B0H14DRAFT_2932068 [Mycena olivaceomarginata]
MSGDLNLTPRLVRKPEDLLLAGQSLSATLSPLDNSLAVFVTTAVLNLPGTRLPDEEQPIYFPSIDAVPSSERRLVRSAAR